MPNLRGGKAYKKSKGKSKLGEDGDVVFIDKQSDQMVGRIVRLLGNRNTSVYCETRRCGSVRFHRVVKNQLGLRWVISSC